MDARLRWAGVDNKWCKEQQISLASIAGYVLPPGEFNNINQELLPVYFEVSWRYGRFVTTFYFKTVRAIWYGSNCFAVKFCNKQTWLQTP